jgi:hypothetical protein
MFSAILLNHDSYGFSEVNTIQYAGTGGGRRRGRGEVEREIGRRMRN